jgi:hypothetical protein
MPPKATTSTKRSKGKQPVKPGPSKKARREPAPPVHTRRTRAAAARQGREDTESPLSSVPEATPVPVPEKVSETEEEEEEEAEEEKEAEEEEEEEEEAPIVPVAIRPAQVRTGGRGQSSLCWKYYTRVVVGSRRTKKGNEFDKVEARCKLCTVE